MEKNKELLWEYVCKEISQPILIADGKEGVPQGYVGGRKLYLDISEFDKEGNTLPSDSKLAFQKIDFTLPLIIKKAKRYYNSNLVVIKVDDQGEPTVYPIDNIEVKEDSEGLDIFKVTYSQVGQEEQYLTVLPIYKDFNYKAHYPNNNLLTDTWNRSNYNEAIDYINEELMLNNKFFTEDEELELIVTRFGDREVLHLDGVKSAFGDYDYTTNFSYIHVHRDEGKITLHYISPEIDSTGAYVEKHLEFKVKNCG